MLKKMAYPRLAEHMSIHRQHERQLDKNTPHLVRVRHASQRSIEAALYLRSILIDYFFRKDIANESHVMMARGT
jgi:hypothetical protein